ncbi:MAG: shikimate dehydrogenase [bacterium]|nr:shikimate dehydrogenase [bacterium]
MEYGLIGEKLGHSFSKIIHEMIADYKYELKEIAKEDLDSFMKNKDFKCINVTIPYKTKVLPYLDFISDEAKKIGCVNTILNKDGKLYGYNTDYYGLKLLIQKQNVDLTNKNVLILGTGGTSLTAKAVLADLGVSNIYQASRKNNDGLISYDDIYNYDINYVVNTTPVGMYPNNLDKLIDINKFKNIIGLVDVIYNPLNTNLVLDGKNKNIPADGGLYMLIAQAVYAIKLFKNMEIDDSKIDEVYNMLIKQKQNIVLIGMPSCGKSTIGRILEKRLNKALYDSDTEIEKIIDSDISSFMKSHGERQFRNIESSVIENLSKQNGIIISTGGGVILRKSNMNNLKQNGIVVFVDRPLDKLIPTESRPLTSDKEALKKKYDERIDLYNEYADIKVVNDTNLEDVVNEIIRRLG